MFSALQHHCPTQIRSASNLALKSATSEGSALSRTLSSSSGWSQGYRVHSPWLNLLYLWVVVLPAFRRADLRTQLDGGRQICECHGKLSSARAVPGSDCRAGRSRPTPPLDEERYSDELSWGEGPPSPPGCPEVCPV